MQTAELTTLTHIPGHRLWCISRFGNKADLIVTNIPDDLPHWEITNRAVEAEFVVERRARALALDIADAEASGPPTVTWEMLLAAKQGGAARIALKTKMGRRPKNGIARTERIDLRLTPEEKFFFERKGGVHWLYDELNRESQKSLDGEF